MEKPDVEASIKGMREGELAQSLIGCYNWESEPHNLSGSTVEPTLEAWVQMSYPKGMRVDPASR